MITFHWVILCRKFNDETKNIEGMFDSVRGVGFPSTHPHMDIVTKWEGMVGDSFSQTIEILPPNSKVPYVTSDPIKMTIGIRYQIARQGFPNLPIPVAGTYTVVVKADGVELGTTTFDAEVIVQ